MSAKRAIVVAVMAVLALMPMVGFAQMGSGRGMDQGMRGGGPGSGLMMQMAEMMGAPPGQAPEKK